MCHVQAAGWGGTRGGSGHRAPRALVSCSRQPHRCALLGASAHRLQGRGKPPGLAVHESCTVQVKDCEAYQGLSKGQTDLVAAEACRQIAQMQALMHEVSL